MRKEKTIKRSEVKTKKDLPVIPMLFDVIQEVDGNIELPEIRVWCHPNYINKNGEDYYEVFPDFKKAIKFCEEHKEAEDYPLIAFRGFVINLFELPNVMYEETVN